jgi:broad specificity phosphatase PhoE
MTTRVYLVRHGATPSTAEDVFSGMEDVPLSDAGRQQVEKLARRLAGEPIVAFYASPMSRSMETARILASPHRLSVTPRDGLREISHGRWEGKKRSEVERLYPDEYARWERDPYSFAPEGGETGLSVTARALPDLLALVSAHSGAHFVVVSHKATLRLIVSSLLGFDARSYRDRLDQSPASLNILDFVDPTRARLTLFNDTSHYADAGAQTPAIPARRLSKWWDSQSGTGKR